MNQNVSILFSTLFLIGVIIPVSAQTDNIADHIVINEIDLNPSGDDSVTITEWVELYNPTSSPVDLSGWKIASTTVLKKTMTIPGGTIIEPGQFKTFSYQSLWFTDTSEIVELRDFDGQLVDKTPSITDIKNNFTSWQRVFDGFDSDSNTDWKFAISTAGSSNGKISSDITSDEVTVSINSDKQNYNFGETAIISGSVSEKVTITKPYFQPAKIFVKITGPNYFNQFEFYPDFNLKYKTSLNLQKVFGFNEGVYNIAVSYADATANTSFSLGDVIVQEKEVTQSELSIYTDKSEYMPGQTVTLFGITSDIIPFEGLKFKVTNPNGVQIYDGTIFPNRGSGAIVTSGADDADAQFSTTLFMSTVNPVYGEYVVTAAYFDQLAQTTFTLSKDVKEDVLISLSTDKEVYGLGETVHVSGRLNNLWTPSFDLEIIQTTNNALGVNKLSGGGFTFKISDVVRLNGDGTFLYSFKIPNQEKSLGDYKITVSKDIGSQSKSITVVSNPDSYVASDEPLSLSTDKQVYDLGDVITISGNILNPVSRSSFETPSVFISFETLDGKVVSTIGKTENSRFTQFGTNVPYQLTAIPDSSGRFVINTKVGTGIFSEGTYVIKAQYLDLKSSTTVKIQKPLETNNRLIVKLDKQVYGLGDTVTISGVTPPVAEKGVSISLFKPDGSKRDSGTTVDNQRFSWQWTAPIASTSASIKSTDDRSLSKSNLGIYKAIVSVGTLSETVLFKISEDPQNDTLTIPPLSVTTEKSIYKAGEKLKVIGQVTTRTQGTEGLIVPERVSLEVLSGKFPYPVIHQASVYPKQDGSFQSLFELPVTIFSADEYKVKATYLNKKAETNFSVANDFAFGVDAPVSLIASTDKKEYYPGDSVLVSGKPNKLVYLETYDISVIKKSTTEITCGTFYCGKHAGPVTQIRPSPDGSFSYVFPIPDKPSSIGSYEVTVDMNFDTKSIKFDVVEKPPQVELESQKKFIEKENRISDNEIKILTQEKIIEDATWKPRVLLGSMLTPNREDISNVNLQINSESGLCIIGQAEECLVKESTRKPGAIYDVIEIDGQKFNVRYSGPDARLEKFSILPESDSEYLPDSSWDIQVIKDDEVSRLYYKINYSIIE